MQNTKPQKQGAASATATRKSLSLMAGLALLLVPLGASAQPSSHEGHGKRPPKCLPSHIKAQLATFDANKNGRLDPEEHHAMREAERKADLATFDLDRDGRLNEEEHKNLRHAKMVMHFEELDRDQNAEISKQEAVGSCTPIEHHFARIDSDSNGSITWSEFEKAAPRRPRGPQGPGGSKGHHPKRRH